MNVLQHTRNELNLSLKENRPDRSYRDTLLNLAGITKFKYERKNAKDSGRSNKMTPLRKWPIVTVLEIFKKISIVRALIVSQNSFVRHNFWASIV